MPVTSLSHPALLSELGTCASGNLGFDYFMRYGTFLSLYDWAKSLVLFLHFYTEIAFLKVRVQFSAVSLRILSKLRVWILVKLQKILRKWMHFLSSLWQPLVSRWDHFKNSNFFVRWDRLIFHPVKNTDIWRRMPFQLKLNFLMSLKMSAQYEPVWIQFW